MIFFAILLIFCILSLLLQLQSLTMYSWKFTKEVLVWALRTRSCPEIRWFYPFVTIVDLIMYQIGQKSTAVNMTAEHRKSYPCAIESIFLSVKIDLFWTSWMAWWFVWKVSKIKMNRLLQKWWDLNNSFSLPNKFNQNSLFYSQHHFIYFSNYTHCQTIVSSPRNQNGLDRVRMARNQLQKGFMK